jgi:probable HAF family extracellular repeat protein
LLILGGDIPGLVAVTPASAAAAKSAYAVTNLGTYGLDPVGEAIDYHDVIAGQSSPGPWSWSGEVLQNFDNLILPGSGFTLGNAAAIKDNGQIVAGGSNAQGQEHAFLLTQLASAPRIYRPPP